jgi:toxoflavin synthase
VGYDRSPQQIELARAHVDARISGIEYVVATPQTFSDDRRFDLATSIMVLPYANNVAELGIFFRSVSQCLVAGGKFVSVTLNPRFAKFETDFFIRRMMKLEGNLVMMKFIKRTGEQGLREPLYKRQYTQAEYEQAAAAAGMGVAWKSMTATPEAMAAQGEAFWRPVNETQPYTLIIAQRK